MSAEPEVEPGTLPDHSAVATLDVEPEPAQPPPVWLLPAALLLAALSLAGSGLVASLAPHHPLWLITLNPLPRNLILVAPHTPMLPLVAIAWLRGLFGCWVTFELGRFYGPQGVSSVGGSSTTRRIFQIATKLFGRWSAVLLTVFPGVMTAALAGTSGVTRTRTLALSSIGLIAWAFLNHRLGGLLAPWTVPILRFVEENMLTATLLCCLGVVAYYFYHRRKFRPERAPSKSDVK